MEIEKLRKVLRFGNVPFNHAGLELIAAGPLNKQPSTVAYRKVLVASPESNQFIIYNQTFSLLEDLSGELPDKSYLSDGSYFEADRLETAVKCFGDKLAYDSVYMESLYRDIPKD